MIGGETTTGTPDRGPRTEPDAFDQIPFAAPPGATEVVLVRHGASAPAVAGISFPLIDGRGDPQLSEAGCRQARAAAERLAGEDIDAVFVTSLRRTRETAEPLLAVLACEPVVVADLVEVHLGSFEGGEFRVRAASNDPVFQRIFSEERWDVVPGAEPADEFAERVRNGLQEVVSLTGPDRRAVAYVHGAVIGELCRQATASKPLAFVHADNGSITRIVVDASGSWLLRSFNDIAHL